MNRVRVEIEGFVGERLPVEVRTSDMKFVARGDTGMDIPVQSPGHYVVSAQLPQGRKESWVVEANAEPETLTWVAEQRQAEEQRQGLAWAPGAGEAATWSAVQYRLGVLELDSQGGAAQFRLEGRLAPLPSPDADPQALVLRARAQVEGVHLLQVASPGRVPRTMALPIAAGSASDDCLVRIRTGWSGVSLAVEPASASLRALLAFLASGRRELERRHERISESLLHGKVSDPIGATIGAAALVRADMAEHVASWIDRLAEMFPWLPDGAALAGEVWYRLGERDRAASHWLEAARRGAPLLTDSCSYLVAGLSALAHEGSAQREAAMQRLGAPEALLPSIAATMDFSAPFVSFTALDPARPRQSQEALDVDEGEDGWISADREASAGDPVEKGLEPMGSTAPLRIEVLPAGHGDCLIVEWGARERRRILVDGGARGTGARLRARIEALDEHDRRFELLVVTHVDADHIEGVLELLERPVPGLSFQDIWFNGYAHLPDRDDREELGPAQGERLSALLSGYAWNRMFGGEAVAVGPDGALPVRKLPGGMEITVLSPTRSRLARLRRVWERECLKAGLEPGQAEPEPEAPPFLEPLGPIDVEALADSAFEEDDAEANGSSIALLLKVGRKRVLLAGDAHPSVLRASIARLSPRRRLRLAAFKIPHHGSKANMQRELLEAIECKRYLVSTSGAVFHHPNREAIARIVRFGGDTPELVFNYRSAYNEEWDDQALQAEWAYSAHYPEPGVTGTTVEI